MNLPNLTPEKLTALRLSKGLTLSQAAYLCGVTLPRYKRWEHGDTPMPRAYQFYLRVQTGAIHYDPATAPEPWTAARIRALRENFGLSTGEMARTLQCSRNCMYQWEAGTASPRPASIKKLNELAEQLKEE